MKAIGQSSAASAKFAGNAFAPYLQRGYRVLFVTSGTATWRNLGPFVRQQGAHEFIDQQTLRQRYPEAQIGTWGVPDEYMFRYMEERLAEATAPLAVRRIRIEHAAAAHRARPARGAGRCSGRRAWRRPARRTPAAPSRTGPAPAFPPTAARHAPDGGPRRYAHAAASRRAPCRPAPAASASPPGSSVSSTSHGARAGSNARPPPSRRARSHSCRCRPG